MKFPFPIFSNDKQFEEHKNFEERYEKDIIHDIDNGIYPTPVYKVERIRENDNSVVFVLHMVRGMPHCPLFETIAVSKKELKNLIKSIMEEDGTEDKCESKLYDDSYETISRILEITNDMSTLLRHGIDDIKYILYVADLDVGKFTSATNRLVVSKEDMEHDSYFIKQRLHDFEHELSKYGYKAQVDEIKTEIDGNGDKYIKVLCSYRKDDEDDKNSNSNNN